MYLFDLGCSLGVWETAKVFAEFIQDVGGLGKRRVSRPREQGKTGRHTLKPSTLMSDMVREGRRSETITMTLVWVHSLFNVGDERT